MSNPVQSHRFVETAINSGSIVVSKESLRNTIENDLVVSTSLLLKTFYPGLPSAWVCSLKPHVARLVETLALATEEPARRGWWRSSSPRKIAKKRDDCPMHKLDFPIVIVQWYRTYNHFIDTHWSGRYLPLFLLAIPRFSLCPRFSLWNFGSRWNSVLRMFIICVYICVYIYIAIYNNYYTSFIHLI